MEYFESGHLRVAYVDTGSGTPVMLLHCSSASHKEWNKLTEHLVKNYRVAAPDLIGYGESDRLNNMKFDPYADVNMIINLANILNEPFHMVGHSYGGAMALEAARQLGDRIISLTLIEPVAFHLLRIAGKTQEWSRMIYLSKRVRDYVDSGKIKKAAALYMGFWIGKLNWLFMPGRRKKYIFETMPKVANEFSIMEQVRVTLDDYAGIRVPVHLIMGSKTRQPAKEIIDILIKTLPDVKVSIVKGAGHMSPFTHRERVNNLIFQSVLKYEDKNKKS